MTFETDVSKLHEIFFKAGFETKFKFQQYRSNGNMKNIIGCIIIASKNNYDFVYVGSGLNKKNIASTFAKQNDTPRIIICGDKHGYAFSIKDFESFKIKTIEGTKKKLQAIIDQFDSNTVDNYWMINREMCRFFDTMLSYYT